MNASAVKNEPLLTITRVFDAPRDVVFRAWTDPQQFARWFGPRHFTIPFCDIDARPGGVIHYCMRSPDGQEFWTKGSFREVVPPERLAFSQFFVDADGNRVPPSTFGMPPETPEDLGVTVTFTEKGGKTTITMQQSVPESLAQRIGAREGWSQTLDKLGDYLDDAAREISATRVFDAPRALVFRMWTDPKHIARWWGPNGFTTTIHSMDVRPGGTWEFIMHGPDGRDYKNKFVYVEVKEPERIVYDHVTGPLFRATATFEEIGQKTRINVRMLFESAELRNRVAEEYGAVEGLQQTLSHLDAQLLEAANDEEFSIIRSFDAPRELVWKVWTDPEHMKKWFGPKGTTGVHAKNDFRVGGTYHYALRTPDGNEMWGRWVYREIVPPERFVCVQSFSDPQGGITRHPMSPDWPAEMLATITFDEHDGKTTVAVRWIPINATDVERKVFAAAHASMRGGWGGTFEQLADYLKTL